MVLAVRRAPPVGHHDPDRRCDLARPGLPRGEPGLRVSQAGRVVSRPLAPEEDLARALLDALGPAGRAAAVVSDQAPPDIRTGTRPRAAEQIEPPGVAAAGLGPAPRAVLGQLVALYLGRLADGLAAREATRLAAAETLFRLGRPDRPGTAALLPGPGRRPADRVRQHQQRRQPRAHGAAPSRAATSATTCSPRITAGRTPERRPGA